MGGKLQIISLDITRVKIPLLCLQSAHRAGSSQLQEVVLHATHIAATAYVNALKMSRLDLVFGQNIFGSDTKWAGGLDEQYHFVSFDLSLYKLLRHF